MKKIYLSGPISNDIHYREKFAEAQMQLEYQGFTVINPCDLSDKNPNLSEREYMRHDLFDMLANDVDAVAVLPGYKDSLGATTEVFIANRYGIKIIEAFTLREVKIYSEFELCKSN